MCRKKFYISTAIMYTSGVPHIGNTYEVVLADAIARYKRLEGYDVYFQTGTDEHGQKIEIKAKEAGMDPKSYVDSIYFEIKNIWDVMNTSYSKFVRTTDYNHVRVVQDIFKKFYEQGDIYKGEYSGLYCTPCESFWTDSQLVNGKCPDCGREVHTACEEAYFFKMSKYSKWLKEYIDSHPYFIEPEARKNEIVKNFIEPGLQDLCVSRTSFKWGIPVSFDNNHVIYVWVDALSNYITNLGYVVDGDSSSKFKEYWPCDIHLIGKDILRFHAIYWPIMLHALNLPMPKKIFGHPWLLIGNDKMSKSKGNIVYALDLANKYGVDSVRYYLLHEMPYSSDGTFTIELFVNSINTSLANALGNLVNRTLAMVNKYSSGIVVNGSVETSIDQEFKVDVVKIKKMVDECMDKLRVSDALDLVFDIYRRANKYIDETTPWILGRDNSQKDRLNTVLYNLVESIRMGTVLLQAFLPDTAFKIFKQINTDMTSFDTMDKFGYYKSGSRIGDIEVLFKRIDIDKK